MEGPDPTGATDARREPARRAWRRPGLRAALGLACVAAACAAFAVAASGGTTSSPASTTRPSRSDRHRARPRPVSATVSVSPDAARTPVPRSYLGLSTEYWALPLWSAQMPVLERALALVRVRGDGPLILRVGGDSADHTFWDPTEAPMPAWAFSLAPRWLSQARALVHRLGVRLILDLNLITDTPAAAAQLAGAARSALPRGSIEAFEVGNEPDVYSRADWLAITADRGLDGRLPGRHTAGVALPAALTARDYLRDFRAYAAALSQVAPQVMLGGPALANPIHHGRWITTLVDGAHRSLGMVTIHRYPYTGCPGRRHTSSYATIGRILSPAASAGMAAALRPLVDDAHDAGLPLRLTELNSVNCGGRAGVSDAFATALWAPDALFSLLRAGVDGVNLHVRASAVNAPFALGPAGLQARPLLYGLILFARTLGPDAQLVTLRARLSRPADVGAWAVRVGRDTLHVLLIDKSRRAERVSLRLPATGTASVLRLLAPSAAARTGVTLGGRGLGTDGRWEGTAVRQTVISRGGAYAVDVRAMSAALITVRVRAGTLGAGH
ncbi:MAG TPA: glycosyl hydrolase family 79 C-terminal domain-containing protein [Solirubrobacteraceae bacterium]|nr:glycosyl hydrolase family 79 C-terminal domain-containing protein [Solirubrobacteraceae bacterium]